MRPMKYWAILESRQSYERLRFGGYRSPADDGGASAEETIDPASVFQDMEHKLRDEARKEMLSALLKQSSIIKQELEIIRKRTVEQFGL